MTLPGYRNERVKRKYIQQDIGGIYTQVSDQRERKRTSGQVQERCGRWKVCKTSVGGFMEG